MNLAELANSHFKDYYHREIERRDKIYNSLSLPIGLIIVLAGSTKYVLSQFQILPNDPISLIFIVLLIFSSVYLIRAAYFLIKVIVGYKYSYISLPHDIKRYQDELFDYYSGMYAATKTRETIEDMVKSDLLLFLTDQYIRFGTTNTIHNDDKSEYRYKSHLSLVYSLVFLGGSFIIILIEKFIIPFLKSFG